MTIFYYTRWIMFSSHSTDRIQALLIYANASFVLSATILSKNGMNFKYRHWWSCLSCCQLHLLINWISSKIFANSFGISGITRKVKEWKRIFIFQYFWLEFLKIRNRMFLECFEYLEIMHLRNWKFEEIFTYLFYRKSFILV